MNIFTTLIKGLVWGFGFSVALLSSMWVFQTYVGSPPHKVEYSWADSTDDTEPLDKDELANIDINVELIDMVEGKLIILGELINNTDRDAFWVRVELSVYKGDRIIEKCKDEDGLKLPVRKNAEFSIFCASQWNEIKIEDIQVKAKIRSAFAYKSSSKKKTARSSRSSHETAKPS